ncbi:hypothetical protein SETIT_1G148100v2 [Setaria italica]|uniref:UBC core domain-containing protein n=2 Tax=Setaria TaxID=4554 RepID=A0A368PKD3_SETIT|nr:hypothetical protein SETIT_1G148100v2 [Setaria italica]TKW38966.1 hypothetical protein SEVIR_1G147032v2 [Setaria viridis]
MASAIHAEKDYVLEGSKGTPFEGRDHAILYNMTTPSGRFAPHKRICLSMSEFHPESWNPMWSVVRLTKMGDKL